jgi:hypothetical protein
MATLADLFEDTPAEVVLTSPPKLTVVPATPPAVQAALAQPVSPQPTSRVDASQQTLRDSDSRMILESEVKKAESRQADLLREYNSGQPEKRGGEAQDNKKYLDRVAELKASLARNESDMAGIRRELGRVPASKLTVVPPTLSDPFPIAAYPPAQFLAQPAQPVSQTATDVGNFSDLFETTVPAYQPGSVVQKPAPQVSAFAGTRGDTGISGGDGPIAQAALKHLKALGAAAASLADTTIGGIIPAVAGPLTYAGARALQLSPAEAAASEKSVVGALEKPFGKTFGVTESPAYKGELSREIMDFIGENVGKGAKYIAEQTGIPESDVANMIGTGLVGVAPAVGQVTAPVRRALGSGVYEIIEPVARGIDEFAGKPVPAAVERPRVEPTMAAPLTEAAGSGAMSATQLADTQAAFAQRQAAARAVAPVAAPAAGSVGAAAVPTITTIQQALLGATPELKAVLTGIPFEQTNVPTFMRHIEADSLPVPIRLTKGQASGDIVQLSNEQNRRGKDTQLAQRFNEQNGLLIDNINEIRTNAAPDAYGTKIIENSQGIIDAYKTIDGDRNKKISTAYKALEDANGGQFPIDGAQLASNAEAMLGKKLKTEFLPPSIKSQLERFKSGEPMTFEQFEAMRTNLAAEIRKAERSGDGNAAMASSIVREALEQLPLTGEAATKLKPLADSARSLAKERFDMLKKDPAYKAAVDDVVPADKYLQKFVVNGVNKNIATMVNHLGKDSVAHQHMAAGTVNWLKDKAGIVDETGNFTQAGFNKALKQLDDVKNMEQIFTPEAASQLKTLGNVARYTQAQPRGAFVNNSNTLVGALAEKAKQGISAGVEGGLNVVAPGLQLGTTVMEMRARRANEAEVRKALEIGAGTKK